MDEYIHLRDENAQFWIIMDPKMQLHCILAIRKFQNPSLLLHFLRPEMDVRVHF